MARHARSKINFPEDIKDSYSLLIEIFHDMAEYERKMCIRNLESQLLTAQRRVEEYTPLIPYLKKVMEDETNKEI